mgnify:CR=1 FL=1
MENSSHTFFIAKNLSDIFSNIRNNSSLQILGGCTRVSSYAERCMSIRGIEELQKIDKRERYIFLGPGVTLSEIMDIGRNHLPEVLYDALATIGTPQVRNLATLGGNICAPGQRLTLWAPLLALDARLEFKSQNATKYVDFNKFNGVPEKFILTKIRIPIKEWNVSLFKRVGPSAKISPQSASFVFLVDIQKDQIVDIRIAFAGIPVFRSHELENDMLSAHLPLSSKRITELVEKAANIFTKLNAGVSVELLLRTQFLNLLRYSLESLTGNGPVTL